MGKLRDWAARLRRDATALYLAARDPRTPWCARALGIAVAAYALSPIDLIPDFIPVIGLLDDLIIVPLGIWLAVRMIPPHVLEEHRRAADAALSRPLGYVVTAVIVLLWIAAVIVTGLLAVRVWRILGKI
ncbi:YkvA family protein [Tepidamorphus sp. 3E244]|uniref:YkvA family protein n=1 Tax=Tepidamorphus sp. 3E244 TaxID=3385498 RepID=UPI0038FC8185